MDGRPMDELHNAAQAAWEDTTWYTQEDADTWQLFCGIRQIIKAPKHDTDYAEYWPTPADSAHIVRVLNEYPALLAALTTAQAERDALHAAAFAAWAAYDEDEIAHSPALQAAMHRLYAVLGAGDAASGMGTRESAG